MDNTNAQNKERPLTLADFYNIMLPELDRAFSTKFVTKDEFNVFKDKVLSFQDYALKQFDILITEKGGWQLSKEKRTQALANDG